MRPESDNRHLEQILPLIHLSMRASANPDTNLSPFFILHGYHMPLPIKSEVPIPDTFHSRDAQKYAEWLENAIKALHETVRIGRIEAKQDMKTEYNKRHRAKEPDFKVGDQVLLLLCIIDPGSNRILTRRPYGQHPYIIKQVVNSHGAGSAYKLTDPDTGRDIRGLINHDRLKYYLTPRDTTENVVASSVAKPCYKPAEKILQDRILNGTQQFLVLFEDRELKWLAKSQIGDGLLAEYLRTARKRVHI